MIQIVDLKDKPFNAQWFDPIRQVSEEFLAVAAISMTYDEYEDLWEKLDYKIGGWMHENNKPYGIYFNHKTALQSIYFATMEDAIVYRLTCI